LSLVIAKGLTKTYRAGDVEVPAIKGADFVIEPASFVAFVGPSGSGKSTLLNMIGCLDHPTSGKLTVLGIDIATLDRRAAADFRGKNIGFIFQDFNLVPVLTAYENIEYPLIMVQRWTAEKRCEQVMRIPLEDIEALFGSGTRPALETLGREMQKRREAKPSELTEILIGYTNKDRYRL